MSSSAIKVRCACVWVLEALKRWRSCSEVTSRASRPYGEMKGSSVLTAAHHVFALTWQSSLTSLDLWQPVYLPIIASLFAYHFPQRKRLLLCSQFILVAWLERGIHSRCYQALAVNLGIWELFLCFKSPNVVFLLIWWKGQNREVSSLLSLNRWAERDRRFQCHCLMQIWRETAAGVQ